MGDFAVSERSSRAVELTQGDRHLRGRQQINRRGVGGSADVHAQAAGWRCWGMRLVSLRCGKKTTLRIMVTIVPIVPILAAMSTFEGVRASTAF